MSTFIKNIFENSEETPIYRIALALFGLVMVRIFLENFSSPSYTGTFFPAKESFLHFPVYYTSVFLSFALVLYFFTKKSLQQILNFEIRIFLLILIPPIVDLIATGGKGEMMAYVITGPQNFFYLFFRLMDPLGFAGITMGIHAAAYLIFFSMAFFIYKATNKISKALLGIIVSYSILFLYAISPSIIALPQFFSSQAKSASVAYELTLKQSWMASQASVETQRLSLMQITDPNVLKSLFDSPLTQLFFIILTTQLFLLFVIYYPILWKSLRKNLRLERILFWFFVSFVGFFIEQKIFENTSFSNSINIISFCAFLLVIALNIWLAICINDSEDVHIDQVSNPNRPLVKKEFTHSQWKKLQVALLVLVLFGISTMNQSVVFFLVLAQMAYYIYSAEPLRLKKHFVSSSIIIGVVAVAISMAGFFLASPDQHISAFPVRAIWLIGISVALISNFKDIKDFNGDMKEKIKTIPVVFGLSLSKIITAVLFSIVFISLPIFLGASSLIFFAICASLFMCYILINKNYQEKYIFLLLFIYLLIFFLNYK